MVHALREAHRVLTPSGVLVDVRPVIAPIVVEVVIATQAVWAKTIESYSAPEDIAAADAAVQQAVSRE
jgi:ubiquinone/menaquinone biosynthesis C-methylase UbiE